LKKPLTSVVLYVTTFIFLWFSLLVQYLHGLDPTKSLRSYLQTTLDFNDGLPQNAVMTIEQTRDGYIWMGTQEGLARFNGDKFTVFDEDSSNAITNNYIKALMEDARGNLWIGSMGGGIIWYKEGMFFRPVSDTHTGIDITTLQVHDLAETRDGTILVGTRGNGVLKVKDGAVSEYHIPREYYNSDVMAVMVDHEGNIFIGTNGSGLLKVSAGSGDYTRYTRSDGLGGNQVKVIFEDSNNNLWIGTASGGVSRFDNGKFKTIDVDSGLSGNNIVAFCEDKDGNVWIGTHGKGINRYRDGIISSFDNSDGLSSNIVASIFEGKEGGIWIGTEGGGVERLSDRSFEFLDKESGLSHNFVFAILEDNDSAIYITTQGGGVNKLKNGKITVYDTKFGITNDKAFAIYKDDDDALWIGTYGGGLNRVKDGHVTVYTQADGLSYDFIWSLTGDSDGNIWIGTDGGGLNRFKDGKFTIYNTSNGLAHDRITFISEDSHKNLWVGTYGGGLNLIKNGRIEKIYNRENGLAHNQVMAIYEDTDGILWFGTKGGISRFKNGTFTNITKKDGLFDNLAFQILKDDYDNFWMSCNKGLYRVAGNELRDFADGKIDRVNSYSYGKADGMKSVECNGACQPAGYKTKDGRLLFPTIMGVVIIEPGNFRGDNSPPPVVIETVSVDMKEVEPRQKAQLEPGSTSIEIHYAGLTYSDNDKVRYRYRLLGHEDRWVDVGNRKTAFFMNLSPGLYRFQVIACSSGGIWNEEGATFEFFLKPYVYQNWWFYGLVVFTIIFLGLGAFRWRNRQLRKRKIELEQLVDQRTRQLKKATEIARQEREAADEANQAKGEFLARMSHEIRTPMNSVIGFTQMLLETQLTEEQLDYTATINRSGEALISIINDILDFSKIEAGKLTLDPVDFDPEAMAYEICEAILPRIVSRPVEVCCRIDRRVPPYVRQDAGRYRQVLMNLMANAAKFTREGEIQLEIKVDKEEKELLLLHAVVKDSGIGILPEKISSIFNVFQQADGSITRKYGGTGLGLSISKQISRHMNGDISVESTPEKGSTFHFTAWVQKSDKKPDQRPVSKLLEGRRILIVDDNPRQLETMKEQLIPMGIIVNTITNGQKAVTVLEEGIQDGKPYDLCMVDLQMPIISGYDVAAQIRKLPLPVGKTPLLGLSYISCKPLDSSQQTDFDGFLLKPVYRQRLLSMLKRILLLEIRKESINEVIGEKADAEVNRGESETQPLRILLVEDNPLNQKLARFMLSKAGYQVAVVNNGKEAVERFTLAPNSFDLIFMDIQMPEMDGREATRIIRERGHSDIPIIAMTAESMQGASEKCIAAGMNDYISKPIKKEVVFEAIKRWVGECRAN
jgi:signal transduction histidine kinase/CheY-like chemotaxis protein/ligand-binding sensor domain-containing protein